MSDESDTGEPDPTEIREEVEQELDELTEETSEEEAERMAERDENHLDDPS